MNSCAWNILCWNVHGLNDKDKWDPIRNKIEESHANIFYLQETKKNLLICVLFVSSLRKDLISLTSAHLWVPLVVFWSAGPQSTSLPF
jgi:hypothetical protein